ncbi:DUF4395 domain-containing protein [Lutibacter sp.]|uniref:DUF4395 domain-containing protein n=1 Tax=Lutibacter sp. TaxID=1925666 RepID=UPI0027359EF7|nr:DUF4395 domain-containing protein [Lutibacter sp.]MDP3313477.1 DUF4395 domain-containing protein [Lutibacter sp.]
MKKVNQFGETVEGYNIPVLNEREIRAAAGILFFFTFLSLMYILFKGDFLMIKYVITVFMIDFIIRVFISPKYAPTLIISKLIVGQQNPEYVGAAQKKFSWIIGVVLSTAMFVLMVLMNSYSIITGLICLLCLIFLFFESVFGICLGCLLYNMVYKENAQHCPGEICEVKDKHEIQKVSIIQIIIVLIMVGSVFLIGFLFNDLFNIKPHDLFDSIKH